MGIKRTRDEEDVKEFFELQEFGLKTWEELESIDFAKEIKNIKVDLKLYSKTPNKGCPTQLRFFDYFTNFASNVIHIEAASRIKPNCNDYCIYNFSKTKLLYIEYVESGRLCTGSYLYFRGDYVISLDINDNRLCCIYLKDGTKEYQIMGYGIDIRCIIKVDESKYRLLESAIFSFIEETYIEKNGGFLSDGYVNRIAKPYKMIHELNWRQQLPFPKSMIDQWYKELKESEYDELE